MHICFIHSHYESLGIEYISSLLKKQGHQTSLIFEPALFHNFFCDNKLLHRMFDFREYILERISKSKPDIIAFSVISDNYHWSLDLARQIKKKHKILVVFGGIHVSSVPEYVLREDVVDYVIVGEGEEPMLDLVEALQHSRDASGMPNIGVNRKGIIKLNEIRPVISQIDGLPFPDKDLFFNEYDKLISASYTVMGSRGCNYSCSYCWNSAIHRIYKNGFFRRRSPSNVIAELQWAKERYKIKKVTFYDEVFTSDKDWLQDFLSTYKKEINLPFFCCAHPDDIDKDTVDLLSLARCSAINIGLQTANEEIRKTILNRRGSNTQISHALKLLRDTNIFVYSNIILGLPGEKEESVIKTLKFCAENKADLPAIYWLRYYPNTKILDMAKNMSIISESEAESIKRGEQYTPYAISGNTYKKGLSRIGNLILLSGFLSPRFINLLIKYKFYRLIVSGNLLFPAIIMICTYKRLFKKKRFPFHYFNLMDYFKLHWFYMHKKLSYHRQKITFKRLFKINENSAY